MKSSPLRRKQKLSKEAALKKAARDKKAALTKKRSSFKAESQRKRRAAKKRGVNLEGKDYDHHTGSFVSTHKNRGGMTNRGTKNE